MTDRCRKEIRQADGVGSLLCHQRVGLDAGGRRHRIFHQPVQADYLRPLQLGAPCHLLRRIGAVMQEELEIELTHIAARVARACRVQAHCAERIGEAAINALDGIQRELALRYVRVGQVGQRRIALQIGQDDRRLDLGEDALEQRIENSLRVLELRAREEHRVARDIGNEEKALLRQSLYPLGSGCEIPTS